jgi:CheY-like chemotaxis protein
MLDFVQRDVMPAKILIIDDDVDTLKLVGVMLQRQGYEISAASNGEQGLAKAVSEKPDVILLDVMMPAMDGYEVARRLRKNPQTETTPILMFTAKTQLDDKVTGFESGADDYITKPTHPAELQAHVRALLSRTTPSSAHQTQPSPHNQHARVIAVLGARGGLGVSTLACNLAGAFYERTKAEVILAELSPGQGTLGMDLGTPSPKGLYRLLSGKVDDITRDRVEAALVQHGSGLRLLLSSESPHDVSLMNQTGHFERLAAVLADLGQFVILDLGAGLPAFSERILPLCDDRLVVIEGSMNTITQSRMLLDEIQALGIQLASVRVILNTRVRGDTQMTWVEIEKQLGHPIDAKLMAAPELLVDAARMHIPAVFSQPANVTSQQILKLADDMLGRDQPH